MQLHYVATTYRRSVRSRTVRKESRLSSRAAAHRRRAEACRAFALVRRVAGDAAPCCSASRPTSASLAAFALAAVVGCCCAGERSGTVPASSSVVWPAYGAVRDRMDLMYSPMLVRFYYIIVNSCTRRDAVPTAPEPPHYYYVLS